MLKIEKLQIIKNVGSSWFSLGINVIVGVLLSPFILHRLGDAAFGVWVLIFSLTGYYGLFDLGIRSSVVRYVSKYTATGSTEELAKLINTSLFTYSCVALLSFLVTVVATFYVDRFFQIPPELHSSARWLLLMVGTAVALGFPLGVVGGFLDGLQRFYVNNVTNVTSSLVRALLIVLALNHGYGLLTVALITVVLPIISSIVRGVIALRICPVPFGLRFVDRTTLGTMANYSGVTMMIMIATRLKFKTDELVIGSMMSATAITYFNIGGRIVDYAGEVVTALSQNFVPMSSQSEAKGDINRLRKIFVAGNRFCAFTIFPITTILLFLGKSVIEVWVGKKYVATSFPVMVVLLIPCTILWAQSASGRVLFGIGKHRTWAYVTLTEGVCNLILSIILIRPYGIVGDAFGTAIPLICSMVFFMPAHLCRQLGIRLLTYLREAYTLPLLVVSPLIATLWLLRRWYTPHTYRQLAPQLLICGVVYGLAALWAGFSGRAMRIGELAPKQATATPDTGVPAAAVEIYQQDV